MQSDPFFFHLVLLTNPSATDTGSLGITLHSIVSSSRTKEPTLRRLFQFSMTRLPSVRSWTRLCSPVFRALSVCTRVLRRHRRTPPHLFSPLSRQPCLPMAQPRLLWSDTLWVRQKLLSRGLISPPLRCRHLTLGCRVPSSPPSLDDQIQNSPLRTTKGKKAATISQTQRILILLFQVGDQGIKGFVRRL